MSDLNYLTKETLAQMNEELNRLKTTGRAEIARQEKREILKRMPNMMLRKKPRAFMKQE